MLKIKKCQSKKHNLGGCGDPRCPEGLSIKAAMDEAVDNHDLNSFLAAKDLENAKTPYLRIKHGIAEMTFSEEGKHAVFKFIANRPEAVQHIQSIDKTHLPSFDSVSEMQTYLQDLYRPYAYVSLRDYTDANSWRPSGYDLKRLSVADLGVDADVRGMGVGRHIRATVLKFADEHNYVVTGTPTEAGDGTVERRSDNYEEYKAHCLAHKARLEKFYLDTGYEYNYACWNYSEKDYWTGEPYPSDENWEKKLHPTAITFLRDSGSYIRWPNGEVPENWKAGATPAGKEAK